MNLVSFSLIFAGVMLNAAAQILMKSGTNAIGHFEFSAANVVPIGWKLAGSALRAELLHAVRREMVVTLCDVLVRRTHVFYETPGHAVEQAAALAALVAPDLAWSKDRCRDEVDAYRAYVAREEGFRGHLR